MSNPKQLVQNLPICFKGFEAIEVKDADDSCGCVL